jgi:PAS domain S-box-containing protein
MATRAPDPEFHDVLARIVRAVRELGWNIGALFLHDIAAGTVPVAVAATDPALESTLLDMPPVSLHPDVWRREMFRVSRSYLVNLRLLADDAVQAAELPLSSEGEWPSGNFLVIPLALEGDELGWLSLHDPVDHRPPTLDHIRALEAFVGQAALTLQQARLNLHYRDQVARQAVCNKIAYVINQHLAMADLFSAIVDQLQQVFAFDCASITLHEGPHPHPQVVVQSACLETEVGPRTPAALERIAISETFQARQPYRIAGDLAEGSDLEDEEELIEEGMRSYACLPLRIGSRVIGTFSMVASVPHAFAEEDAGFLVQIADHIAGGVWNALLYEQEQKRRHVADALAQVSKMVNSTLQLDEVLELALQQLARVILYDTASILLVDGPNLQIAACRGFENPAALVGAVFRVEEDNISHRVMRAQRFRVVGDVQQLPEWGHDRTDVEGYERIRAWIGAPLVLRDQSIGLLVIDKLEPDFYTDEDGEIAAAFATQIATAIHNARLYQATQQQRDRLAAILTDTTDAVIVLDLAGQIWLMNPAAERSLRQMSEEVIGQPAAVLGLPELDFALRTVQHSQKPTMSEIAGPEGTTFNASIAPVHEVGCVIVMQDITPFKELDRLRTEWVAAVSHDLKNPIQVVQLGTVLLEMDGPLNDMQLERIATIQRATDQLRTLVTNVLDLARLEAGPSLRLGLLDLAEVISASLAEVEHVAARKEQRLVNETTPALPPIYGDGTLLQRALVNLLSNAIKHTPAGSVIAVRTILNADKVRIEVIDNGPGIPAEALPLLFNRFYRVPGTNVEGTGLGLSIVKSIVEKHRGSVYATSEEGTGSTFTILLPLASPEETEQAA